MTNRVVLNVAVNQNPNAPYVHWQGRLLKSLSLNGGKPPVLSWTNSYPFGSPTHNDNPYAFKLYAIDEARRLGFSTILWLDSGIYAIRNIDPLFVAVEDAGVYIVRDDSSLSKFCSDETFKYFGMTREQAEGLHIACGAVIGLNFRKPVTLDFYNDWKKAYSNGLYRGTVSKHSGMEDHRGDESILGILMARYSLCWRTLKEHFSSDAPPHDNTILRSGYYDREDMPL